MLMDIHQRFLELSGRARDLRPWSKTTQFLEKWIELCTSCPCGPVINKPDPVPLATVVIKNSRARLPVKCT